VYADDVIVGSDRKWKNNRKHTSMPEDCLRDRFPGRLVDKATFRNMIKDRSRTDVTGSLDARRSEHSKTLIPPNFVQMRETQCSMVVLNDINGRSGNGQKSHSTSSIK